jgi:serine/threonine protein kinase
LADFNVAKKIPEGETEFKLYTKSAGTLAFVAPERLKESQEYTEKVDMWAAGLVLFMLLTGAHPFDLGGSTVKLF